MWPVLLHVCYCACHLEKYSKRVKKNSAAIKFRYCINKLRLFHGTLCLGLIIYVRWLARFLKSS